MKIDLATWIKLIEVLTPLIIGILNPILKPVADDVAKAIVKAEQTEKNGPDKLEMVIQEVMEPAFNKTQMTSPEIAKSVADAVAIAVEMVNTGARMDAFNKA